MMNTNSPDDLLQFKDFSNEPGTSSPPQINVNSPTNSRRDPLSNFIYDMGNANLNSNMTPGPNNPDGNGDGDGSNTNRKKESFLTVEYYRQFFNVDTYMVLDRIANSIIPNRAPGNYLLNTIEENPDLYGPFWIGVTLVFSMAITGNIFAYIEWARDDITFHYNFRLVSYGATALFLYVNIFPLILWGTFKYTLKPVEEGNEVQNGTYTPSLLALLCIFGYSLSIYIPVSVLWVIPIEFVRLLLLVTAASLSGIVLIMVLRPALRNSQRSFGVLVFILAVHMILAASFLFLFFHITDSSQRVIKTQKPEELKALTTAASLVVKTALNNTIANKI